jgi:hypothetical protein
LSPYEECINYEDGWDGPCDVTCCADSEGYTIPCAEPLALDLSDPKVVVAALAEFPRSVRYNRDRGAVQVVSCNGSVIRSVTLTEGVGESLDKLTTDSPRAP